MNHPIPAGLAIVQSNFPEQLRQAFLAHVARHPLQPLEDEVVLVQSVGFGRWLQLGMAEDPGDSPLEGGLGISAAFRSELSSRFLWQAYRAVLGEERLPEHSLFDADRLRWLVFRLLGEIAGDAEFEPLNRYLAVESDNAYRRFQLAGEIARLFEAYQFYRADWLLDWEAGRDVLQQEGQQPGELPAEQRWQPALWRALINAAGSEGRQHRGRLHADFVAALENPAATFSDLPRRVSVFGVTSLPEQSLRALAALSRHVQVLVFLHNPCQYYWGNIIEARDVHRRWSQRHRSRDNMPDRALEETEIADWANPLLAAWGKQGRDFIGLLDRMDRPESYRHWFDDRIDLFGPHVQKPDASLLHQIQQSILDLEPVSGDGQRRSVASDDDSVRFVCAHGRQREVEILHDALLEMFRKNPALQPRDVAVMVPNIDDYAPHIEAVFGQFARLDGQHNADPRHIPYSIADRGARAESGFLRTVESLLGLPGWRMNTGEILDLLQVAAVRDRFGLTEADLGLVERWLEGAGVRWGLNQQHRNEMLDTDQAFTENSWAFGLDRMMLGYAIGQRLECADIVAYDEVSPGDARVVASLRELLARLSHWRALLAQAAQPKEWQPRIRDLVDAFLMPAGSDDALDRYRLDRALEGLSEALKQAMVTEPVTLDLIVESLMDQLDQGSSGGRFLNGAVSFCTLMPMRSIPFRVVCLLGMNDGEYPRTRRPVDFDLMSGFPRAGDRSRREDDRYLFLEALLAARDSLYISWIGRSVRDNEKIPPSVLVGQLRDAIAAGWVSRGQALVPADSPHSSTNPGQQLLKQLTIEHPLQPFSRDYFRPGQDRLRTHAREWAEVWQSLPEKSTDQGSSKISKRWPILPVQWPDNGQVRLHQLVSFLKSPVAAFVNQRLQAKLSSKRDIGGPSVDEPVELDKLEEWQLRDELLRHLMLDDSGDEKQVVLERQLDLLAGEGRLPIGPAGQRMAAELLEEALDIGERYFAILEPLGARLEKQRVQLDFKIGIAGQEEHVTLQDWLPNLHGQLHERLAWVEATASKVGTSTAPEWDKLVRYWPQHLAACAAGLPLQTTIVGKDAALVLRAVPTESAMFWLQDLISCCLIGQTRPLSAEPLTAGDYLNRKLKAADKPEEEWLDEALRQVGGKYIGSKDYPGPVERDPALARFYPDFKLLRDGDPEDGFRYWSERIYGPLATFLLAGSAE